MSDNTTLPGTGTVVRTDDIGGVHYPVSKLVLGDDNTDDGYVSDANPLPISVIGAQPLPTGAATESTLSQVLTTIAFQTRFPTLGQKAMAGSVPVTLASDQSAIPVSAASLPLPSGAATETTASVIASALAGVLSVSGNVGISGALPLPTGAATESSLAAVKAAVEGTLDVSAASLPLPSGAATESTLGGVLTTAAFQARIPSSVSGRLPIIGSLGIPAHDYVGISYTGDRVDAYTYKSGGSGGTTVATVTLGYTGDNVTSITKA